MPKKKTPPTQYIAFDESQDAFFGPGTREDVTELIKEHILSNSLEEDDLQYIYIYELGAQKSLYVEKLLDVSF